MASIYMGRRQRPQEFFLPDGKKVIASLPEDLEDLRRKHGNQHGVQVEIVVHGSPEHTERLERARSHHEQRRTQLREKHGSAFDEWEDLHAQLNHVNSQIERLDANTSALDANFDKFGYGAYLRTYSDEEEKYGLANSASSMSDTISMSSSARSGPRYGETIKLFKRPIIKQWFHKGLLWRSSESSEIQAMELFFDLLYVGIIHVNGEHLWSEPTGHELLRYAVTFIMSWKLWSDLTLLLSWYYTDDVLSRLEMLFEIACLLGFTTNMTYSFYKDSHHNTYTMLVSFYLAARLKGVVRSISSAYFLPMIRGVMICECVNILVPSAIWIASIHVSMPNRLALIWIAIALDLWGQSIQIGLYRYAVGEKTRVAKYISSFFEFYPAVNIEHRVERTNAFVSLVFGYSVMGVMFQSYGGTVNGFLGKAVLGLVQAFLFNHIYFDTDSIDVHAIRRSVPSAVVWGYAHLPFIMGYILASAGLSKLIFITDSPDTNPEELSEHYAERTEAEIPNGIRFFYCHGLAVALLFMGVISYCHQHRILTTMRWSKTGRLIFRFGVCIILFLLPLAKSLNSLHLISITLGLVASVLFVELFGKSCRDDPFIGEKKGCSVRYFCKASKKDLAQSSLPEQSEKPERRSVDVMKLGDKEKTGALEVQD